MGKVQSWIIVGVIVVIGGCLCSVLLTVQATVAQLPRIAVETRNALLHREDVAEIDLNNQISSLRMEILATLTSQANALQAKADRALSIVDQRSGDMVVRMDTITGDANTQLSQLNTTMAGVRADLKPSETNIASAMKDAQDSWDQLYPDIQGTVDSATVAVTGIARTAEAVGNAAPKMVESAVSIAKSADSIAADVKVEADIITKPKHLWEKLFGPVYTVGRLVAAFL